MREDGMSKSDIFRAAGLFTAAVIGILLIGSGCSGDDSAKSLDTPRGTVNVFIDRVLEEGDFMGAFELLCEADRKMIMSEPQIYNFIAGKPNPQVDEYTELYTQLAPDLLEILNKLVKLNARKGKAKDGYTEVGLEISYPADLTSLSMIGMGLYSNLMARWGDLDPDTLSSEQKKKIIWSIKNDVKKAAENISISDFATYVFPVKVIEEDGGWRIMLELDSKRAGFGF
jgi:hypothetical protein